MMYVTFFGHTTTTKAIVDLRLHKVVVMVLMIAVLVWLGLFPQPVFDLGHSALKGIEAVVTQGGGP